MNGRSNCSKNVHLTETGIWEAGGVHGQRATLRWPQRPSTTVAVKVIYDRGKELLVVKSLEEAE